MRTTKNILLVEDDDIDAYILKTMLSRNCVDCNIKRVFNGKEALTYVLEHTGDKPDLILLDLNMPIMGGKAFLEAMLKRQNLDDIKVAILTSSGNSTDKKDCVEMGAIDYFEKPMNDFLTKKIMTIIGD